MVSCRRLPLLRGGTASSTLPRTTAASIEPRLTTVADLLPVAPESASGLVHETFGEDLERLRAFGLGDPESSTWS